MAGPGGRRRAGRGDRHAAGTRGRRARAGAVAERGCGAADLTDLVVAPLGMGGSRAPVPGGGRAGGTRGAAGWRPRGRASCFSGCRRCGCCRVPVAARAGWGWWGRLIGDTYVIFGVAVLVLAARFTPSASSVAPSEPRYSLRATAPLLLTSARGGRIAPSSWTCRSPGECHRCPRFRLPFAFAHLD